MIVNKGNFAYYIRDESVTLVIPHTPPLGDSYISFNCFSLQNRRKFHRFAKVIVESGPKEFNNINDIYGLARKFEIRATAGHKPTFVGTIAF